MTEQPEGFRQSRFVAPPGATRITLVRHGESAPAVPGQPFPLRDGHGDPALHPDGEAQARLVGAHLAEQHRSGDPISAIYVTTLQRTSQTAAPLVHSIGVEPRTEADLREVFLGDWEGGLFRERVAAGDPIFLQVISEERWDRIPGAEPAEDLTNRLRAAVGRIHEAHPDQRVVAVSHGGAIGHLLHLAAGSRPFAFAGADNASISELVVNGDQWTVRLFNQTAHLR